MCTIRRDQQRHVFTISTVIVFVFPMCVLTILYILIGLQLRRSKVMKRGTQLGSSIRLKHTIFKKSSQRTIVSINYQNDSPQHYSESMLMQHQPPLQARVSLPGSINACGNSVSNLAGTDAAGGGAAVPTNERSLLANNTHLLAEQTNSLSSEDGRINYSNRVQYHSTRHVVKMLVAVVIAFFLCWAPFHAQRLFAVYGGDQNNNEAIRKAFEIVTHISGILYFVSTCINPVLYNIMSHKFREAFKETLANYLYRRSGHPLRQRMFFRNVSLCSSSINSQSINTCSSVCYTTAYPLQQTSAFNETTAITAASIEACSNQNQIRYRDSDLVRLKRPLVVSFRKIPPTAVNSSPEARQIGTHGCNIRRQYFQPNEHHTTKLTTATEADPGSYPYRKQSCLCLHKKASSDHTQTNRTLTTFENDCIPSPSNWVRYGNNFRPIRFTKHNRWCPIKCFTKSTRFKYSPPDSMDITSIEDEQRCIESQLSRSPSTDPNFPNRLDCKYDLYPHLRNVCLSSDSDFTESVPRVEIDSDASLSLKLSSSYQGDTNSPPSSNLVDDEKLTNTKPFSIESFAIGEEDSNQLGKARRQKLCEGIYPSTGATHLQLYGVRRKASTSKCHSLPSVFEADNNYGRTTAARDSKRASIPVQKIQRHT